MTVARRGKIVEWLVMLIMTSWFASVARAETVRFLVAESPLVKSIHGDSYVLPLSDSREIAHARRLVAEDPKLAAQSRLHRLHRGRTDSIATSSQLEPPSGIGT